MSTAEIDSVTRRPTPKYERLIARAKEVRVSENDRRLSLRQIVTARCD